MRSSQPLMGANKKRCKDDEDLLQAVIEGSDKGYIIDTRSSQQAQQARMAGGGFESKSSYSRWKRLHRQMERCVSLCDLMLTIIFVILIQKLTSIMSPTQGQSTAGEPHQTGGSLR